MKNLTKIRRASGPRRVRTSFSILGPFFLEFFDNWPPAWGHQTPKVTTWRPLGEGPEQLFRPLRLQGSIFIDFLTLQIDIEKSTIFRTLKNQPKRASQSNLWRPRTVFSSKSPPHPAGVQSVIGLRMKSAKYRLKSAPLPPGPPKNRPLSRPGSIDSCIFLFFLGFKFQHHFRHAFFLVFFRFWTDFGCLRQWFRPRAYLGWIACDGVRCVLGFLSEGVGDLGRNWLEKTSRSRHIETALY